MSVDTYICLRYNVTMLVNKLTALDATDLRKLKRLAKLHRKPVNELIRAAVWRYLDDFNDDVLLTRGQLMAIERKRHEL